MFININMETKIILVVRHVDRYIIVDEGLTHSLLHSLDVWHYFTRQHLMLGYSYIHQDFSLILWTYHYLQLILASRPTFIYELFFSNNSLDENNFASLWLDCSRDWVQNLSILNPYDCAEMSQNHYMIKEKIISQK